MNVRLDEEIVNLERQKPSSTWDTVMANVAGTLNFWLGITVFFIAELVEILSHFLLVAIRKKRVIAASEASLETIEA